MKKKAEKQIKEEKKVVEPIFTSRFYWKELSEDGLLKDIKPIVRYYDESNVNVYGGFESREDALRSWAIEAQKGHFVWENFVLIEVVSIKNKYELPRGY